MKCPKCGKPLNEGSNFCIHCGTSTTATPTLSVRLKKLLTKKYLVFIVGSLIVLGAVFYIVAENNRMQKNKDDINDYYKWKSITDGIPETPPNLEFSNLSLSDSNSSYTVATGSVYNAGSKTVKFVTVKVSYKDRSGKVIDTSSTYAVGSEGLTPRESTKWRTSVNKDWNITDISVEITKWNYD